MPRTQIQLTEQQYHALKERARLRNVSMAELIRESIELYLATSPERSSAERRQAALAVAGRFESGLRDLAERHDDYLEKAFSQ
ncbi:MAG: hypothetical protein Kow001_13480 [Acidobacteriota bacterium]